MSTTTIRRRIMPIASAFVLATFIAACGDEVDNAAFEAAALSGVKTLVADELDKLHAAAEAIRDAAPAPDADGWNATTDATAVNAMRAAWHDARVAYEKVEGAIAVLFPDLDAATDERYDGFIAEAPDDNLFDGEGVTGVHAIERILWADAHPDHVVEFESALDGYREARFPANATEAEAFRDELAQQLVDDVRSMVDQFEPLALDPAAAFRGVIGSMEEQLEKVTLAATGEDESRYAGHTLDDMRANLAGGAAVYTEFSAWVAAQSGGAAVDGAIQAGFARIDAAYDAISGSGIPEVPATWNPDAPSDADLQTPYGMLFALLSTESDPENSESLVSAMLQAANLLGIAQLPE